MLEKTLKSPLDCKEIRPVNPNGNQLWIFFGRTDAEALILLPPDAESWHWKRSWPWERLKAGGEEGDRGWDSWITSLIQWTWTWETSRKWWGTGRPSILQSMRSQRVRHDLATEQQQTFIHVAFYLAFCTEFRLRDLFICHAKLGNFIHYISFPAMVGMS